jgi:hypothetical protein
MGDQMEIDPGLYESFPQPNSTLYSPTASLLRLWKDNYRKDAGAAVEKKEVKNLIARTHYLQPIIETDDLLAYAASERIRPMDGDALNPIQWWVKKLDDLPTVAQNALDLLCCPVMSAKCERIFSGAKLLISPNRNQLADDITEAAECLRIWWMRGIIEE